jgi:hypothetical protein
MYSTSCYKERLNFEKCKYRMIKKSLDQGCRGINK